MLTISSIYRSQSCARLRLSSSANGLITCSRGRRLAWGVGRGGGTQFSKYLPFGFLSRTIFLPKCKRKSKYLFRFSWRQKRLTMKCMQCTHGEFLPTWMFRSFGTRRKMVVYIYFGLIVLIYLSRAMRRLTIGPRSARPRDKSPLWESMESNMGTGLVLCLFRTLTVKPPHLKQRQRSHLFVSKMASKPVWARERMKWALLEIWKGSWSV